MTNRRADAQKQRAYLGLVRLLGMAKATALVFAVQVDVPASRMASNVNRPRGGRANTSGVFEVRVIRTNIGPINATSTAMALAAIAAGRVKVHPTWKDTLRRAKAVVRSARYRGDHRQRVALDLEALDALARAIPFVRADCTNSVTD